MLFRFSKTVTVQGQNFHITADSRGAFTTKVGTIEVTHNRLEEVLEDIPKTLKLEEERKENERQSRQMMREAQMQKPQVGNTTAWAFRGERRKVFVKVEVRGASERRSRYGSNPTKALITWPEGKKDTVDVSVMFLATDAEAEEYKKLLEAREAATDAFYEAPEYRSNQYSRHSGWGTEAAKATKEAQATYNEATGQWDITAPGIEPFSLDVEQRNLAEGLIIRRIVAQAMPWALVDAKEEGFPYPKKIVRTDDMSVPLTLSDLIFATEPEAQDFLVRWEAYRAASEAANAWTSSHRYDFGWKEAGE